MAREREEFVRFETLNGGACYVRPSEVQCVYHCPPVEGDGYAYPDRVIIQMLPPRGPGYGMSWGGQTFIIPGFSDPAPVMLKLGLPVAGEEAKETPDGNA